MKTCIRCKRILPLSEFGKNKTKKDGLQSFCRSCQAKARKKHYDKNKKKVMERTKARRKEAVEFIWNVKVNSECAIKDCENNDARGLEFDHIDPSKKSFSISQAPFKGYSLKKIQAEIDKCQVLCAYHHRIKTFEENDWERNASIMIDNTANIDIRGS